MSSSRLRKIKMFAILCGASTRPESMIKNAESENINKLLSGEISVSRRSEFSSDKNLVRFIQNKLMDSGFDLPRFGADGIFGPETDDAVKRAQEALSDLGIVSDGLNSPGVVDISLLNALENIKDDGKLTTTYDDEQDEERRGKLVAKPKSESVIYIGSSSLAGHLGNFVKSILGSGPTFAKTGSQPRDWLGGQWTSVYDAISEHPKKIVIMTGGNGISGSSELVEKIEKTLAEFGYFDTKIIWIGSNPFGADSFDSNGRPYNSKTSYQYLNSADGFKQASQKRSGWNSELKSITESAGGIFIDPFEYIKLKDGTPGFICKSCDGVHLTSSVAQEFVSQISGML
jgi:hypothetical protein